MNNSRSPDIEVEVSFIPTNEGGRVTPAWQGYRVDHDFGIEGMLNVAEHEFIGCDFAEPGQKVRSRLWFMLPEHQKGRLYPGFKFTVCEGSRIVAYGIVNSIMNRALCSGI